MRYVGTLVMLVGCGAAGQGPRAAGDGRMAGFALNDWDEDASGDVGPTEFRRGVREEVVPRWDADRNGVLDAQEVSAALFATWDRDGDDVLDASEWNDRFWRGSLGSWTDLDAWDADGDGRVAREEFQLAWLDSGLYDAWDVDQDAWLTEAELSTALLAAWDADGNGAIDSDEWGWS